MMINYRRGRRHSSREISLEDLMLKFNGLPASTRRWDLSVPTYLHSLDIETGRVSYNAIHSVSRNHQQPAVKISTRSHDYVVVGADHHVLTGQNLFVPAETIRLGDQLTVRGSMLAQGNGGRQHRAGWVRRVVSLPYEYPTGWEKIVVDPVTFRIHKYKRTHYARLVYEAHRNNMGVREFISVIRSNPARIPEMWFLPPGWDVHHQDGNVINDRIENLEAMESADHKRLHDPLGQFYVEYTAIDYVTEIEFLGRQTIYEIAMVAPVSNYALGRGLFIRSYEQIC